MSILDNDKTQYVEIMWAEQKPDCYDGPTCDQLKAQWSCYCDGDKQGEDGLEDIELKASIFPPGTKIVISVPICPNPDCDLNADWAKHEPNPGICECGFDWKEWATNEYS